MNFCLHSNLRTSLFILFHIPHGMQEEDELLRGQGGTEA